MKFKSTKFLLVLTTFFNMNLYSINAETDIPSLKTFSENQPFLTDSNTSYTNKELFKLVISNPKKTLFYIYEKSKNNLTEHDSIEEVKKTFEELEKTCPLFLLGECVAQDEGDCTLSRSYNPKFRNDFENDVVTACIQSLKIKASICYTGFGSGGMFQDLVIIAKTLDQHPDANIAINLIDPKYFPHMYLQDYLKQPREIDILYDYTPTQEFLDHALKAAKEESNQQLSVTDEIFKKNLTLALLVLSKKQKEFISFLQEQFPQARISLSVHSSTDEYLKYNNTHKLNYPDVITAVDIEDENSLEQNSIAAFSKLCVLALQKNPSSKNFWLTKGETMEEPKIISFFLTEVKDGIKKDFTEKLTYAPTVEHIWTVEKKL